MRIRPLTVALAAPAVAAPLATPPADGPLALAEGRASELARHVLRAGTWEEQRAAFERLSEREQVAVWRVPTDVRPGPVRVVTTR